MGCHNLVLLFCSAWCIFAVCTAQLQSSQTQVLLQVKKHLEHPKQLESWKDRWADFCSKSSPQQVNVTCQDDFVTELSIVGDNSAKIRNFNGFPIPNQTLSEGFSIDSFVATLARLTGLKVLRLVSLGIWGPLSDKIHRLSGLEHLDLSSNFLYGSIPPKISAMVNLQILRLDDNFFNSSMPDWFNSLTNLSILSLRGNELNGPFPSSILSTATITHIDISRNGMSGRLPDLSNLNSLKQLDLGENRLDSVLPKMPKGLERTFLSKNSFSGEIPKHFGKLKSLQQLDISFNTLIGTTPAELFSLPNISYLNLGSNMLSGSLLDHLHCGSELRFVDVSHNRLIGGLPSCLSSESENTVVKVEGNCLSGNLQHQHAISYCAVVPMKRNQNHYHPSIGILVGVIVGILVITVILALGFLVICRRYCPRGISEQQLLHKTVQDRSTAGLSELLSNARVVSQASKLGEQDLPVCRTYSFEELKEATNNFDKSTFLGENFYGKLYKGKLGNGIQVAIRVLPLSRKYSIRNFKLRLNLLAKLRHPHLVALLGHCIDGVAGGNNDTNVFLVYEYVANGTFQSYLSGKNSGKVFNWSERLAVLISVAKAVHFLHTGMIPGFFNNRLKTNNILLNEHCMAKLSDYGLSIISEEPDKCGVTGESPTSWQMKGLEDDVYSFGFILLEALVGPSVSAKRESILVNAMASFHSEDGWKQFVDPIVQATCSRDSLFRLISITNKCISPESMSRPSMEDVLWNLQYASQVQGTETVNQV